MACYANKLIVHQHFASILPYSAETRSFGTFADGGKTAICLSEETLTRRKQK
jgi:hypothetical protein